MIWFGLVMKYFLGDSMNIMILLKKVSTRICLENVHANSPKYSIKNTVLSPNWQYKATIVLSAKKVTHLGFDHFITISGHFSANYINISHKTEVLTNNLRCQM